MMGMFIGNPAYPTYQVFLAIAIAALFTGCAMPFFIRLMKNGGIGQQIRADGPQRHLIKQGTPTMGGLVMLICMLITCVIMVPWSPDLVCAMAATLITGSLGLLDDIESVAHERSLGLTPVQKMIGLVAISVGFCLAVVNWVGVSPTVRFPGGFVIDLGVFTTTIGEGPGAFRIPWLYLVFVFLLMAGLSNAVNLTDGLDGLAGGTVMIAMLGMGMVAFNYGRAAVGCVCRGDGRGVHRFFVAQLLSRVHIYGRHRFSRVGCRVCRLCRSYQNGDHVACNGRAFCDRGVVGNAPGRLL